MIVEKESASMRSVIRAGRHPACYCKHPGVFEDGQAALLISMVLNT